MPESSGVGLQWESRSQGSRTTWICKSRMYSIQKLQSQEQVNPCFKETTSSFGHEASQQPPGPGTLYSIGIYLLMSFRTKQPSHLAAYFLHLQPRNILSGRRLKHQQLCEGQIIPQTPLPGPLILVPPSPFILLTLPLYPNLSVPYPPVFP